MLPRILSLFLLPIVLAVPAMAQSHKPVAPARAAHPPAETKGPKPIGKFDDWTAATYQESGQTVCYAFTRAQTSSPPVAGRSAPVLTVTERPGRRDDVAIDAGFTFAADARVTVQVDQSGLDFYTAQRTAFAKDGKSAVSAFHKGSRAIARAPAPKDVQVTDAFSLKGFGGAYGAITKACPSK